MAEETLKVVIPMGGLGTRLRPHTWSKPKQLVSVAGKAVLSHVLDMLSTLPNPEHYELVNIVGYLGDQIETYVRKYYPHIPAHFVLQENPLGQSHAIYLARQHIRGPMLMVFADTLIETDLSFLANEPSDMVAWVKEVPDPRRFGVAEVGPDGWVRRIIEKPQSMENNLVVVGFYYFADGEALLSAIETQMAEKIQLKGEFFLADAINIMLQRGAKMRTQKVDVWLDAGTSDALLETNRYLLEHGRANCCEPDTRNSMVIVPPVFIHPEAKIHNAVIGPYASIGAGCVISDSIVRDSILEEEAQVVDVVLERSLIGRKTIVSKRPSQINAGDHSIISV